MKYISLVRFLVMCAVCLPFSMEKKTFEGSADDIWAHLYDNFKVICVVCHQ